MSKKDKLTERITANLHDFTWSESETLLNHSGFGEVKKGKTAGRRRAFINEKTRQIIRLHKPHPGNILKQYQIKEVREISGI